MPSLNINQFFDSPRGAPNTPIPPVRRILTKPNIEITFIFFLDIKSKIKYPTGKMVQNLSPISPHD